MKLLSKKLKDGGDEYVSPSLNTCTVLPALINKNTEFGRIESW